MRDTIRVTTGIKRIAIENEFGETTGEICFNPSDALFAERFYGLLKELEEKLAEYQKRSKEIDDIQEVDDHGIPVNFKERLDFLHEACEYFREKIDHLFGAGTSQNAFGDTLNLDMFIQFFDGIAPFVQKARSEKLAKYNTQKSSRVMK